MGTDTLRAIETLEFIHGTATVPKRRFMAWCRSSDPDVLALAYSAAEMQWARIAPGLTRLEFGRLAGRLLEASLHGKGRSRYWPGRYGVARSYLGWLLECFRDQHQDAGAKQCIRWAVRFLGSLYKAAGRSGRLCIVNGVLEHLLEHDEATDYFKAWRADRALRQAYRCASEWGVD